MNNLLSTELFYSCALFLTEPETIFCEYGRLGDKKKQINTEMGSNDN